MIWKGIKTSALNGSMPANDSVKIRPTVIAGFANDVDEVKKYAPKIQAATA